MAVVGIDAELIDDFEGILAPILDVDEGVVEWCAVVAAECFAVPEGTGSFVHVRRDDLVAESLEFAVRECDTIEGFELFPEVCFKRGSITDIGAILVLEVPQFGDQVLFKIVFGCAYRHRGWSLVFWIC